MRYLLLAIVCLLCTAEVQAYDWNYRGPRNSFGTYQNHFYWNSRNFGVYGTPRVHPYCAPVTPYYAPPYCPYYSW